MHRLTSLTHESETSIEGSLLLSAFVRAHALIHEQPHLCNQELPLNSS